MNIKTQFKKSISMLDIKANKKADDYCKNYFTAQDKIVKNAILGKLQIQRG